MKKVVTGVAVGALIVAGAVGVLVAQDATHPWVGVGTNIVDVLDGNGNTRVSLDASVEISNRAALVAYPNTNPARKPIDEVTRVDSVSDAAALGNIGYLIVETNLKEWDVLVSFANGGMLTRPPSGSGETGDRITNDTLICEQTFPNGLFGPPENVCVDVPGTFTDGVTLKYKPTPGSDPEPVNLLVGMGIVNNSVFGINASPDDTVNSSRLTKANGIPSTYSVINAIQYGGAGIPVLTPAPTPQTPNAWGTTGGTVGPIAVDAAIKANGASAVSVAEAIGANMAKADVFVPGAFADNATAAAALNETKFNISETGTPFPEILDGPQFQIYRQMNNLLTGHASSQDKSIVFTVTGGLDMWEPGSAAGPGDEKEAAGKLSGNKNGNYTETLTFTFWGVY